MTTTTVSSDFWEMEHNDGCFSHFEKNCLLKPSASKAFQTKSYFSNYANSAKRGQISLLYSKNPDRILAIEGFYSNQEKQLKTGLLYYISSGKYSLFD